MRLRVYPVVLLSNYRRITVTRDTPHALPRYTGTVCWLTGVSVTLSLRVSTGQNPLARGFLSIAEAWMSAAFSAVLVVSSQKRMNRPLEERSELSSCVLQNLDESNSISLCC